MAKFSKGDKARVISVDAEDINEGVQVGDIVTVDQDDSYFPWVKLPNGKTYPLYESQMEYTWKFNEPKDKSNQTLTVTPELTHITIGGKRFRLVAED